MVNFGGEWSEAKLQCVHDYACAYLQVMQKQHWYRLHYVDAFAGAGLQKLKTKEPNTVDLFSLLGDEADTTQSVSFLEGSALRALRASRDAVRGFNEHVFIETRRSACSALAERVRSDFPDLSLSAQFLCGDANEKLVEYVGAHDWTQTRSLVFLDPFGLEVSWQTLVGLAGTEACDVWYLFPLGGVIRMLTRSGEIPDDWAHRLTTLYGTEDWRREFYHTEARPSLFGSDDTLVRDVTVQHVLAFTRTRLSSVFCGGLSKPAVLRNSAGFPMFALMFAIANPKPSARDAALRIANHLTTKLETS